MSTPKENQPQLFMDIPASEHYRTVEKHLLCARKLKLTGMRDILNYICAALIYKEVLHTNPTIVALLEKVKAGTMSFEAAMKEFSVMVRKGPVQARFDEPWCTCFDLSA